MKKHLDHDTMNEKLRLTFGPPLQPRIEYLDHRNIMRFRVYGQYKELLYESRKLPMQGPSNVRLPKHFEFHLRTARKVVEKITMKM